MTFLKGHYYRYICSNGDSLIYICTDDAENYIGSYIGSIRNEIFTTYPKEVKQILGGIVGLAGKSKWVEFTEEERAQIL